jgi:hypothetical protein
MLDKIKWKYYFTHMVEHKREEEYNPKLKLEPVHCPDETMPFHVQARLHHIRTSISNSIDFTPAIRFPVQPLVYTVSQLSRTLPSTKFIAADKNLGLVAINTVDYHKLVLNHLLDTETYTLIGPLSSLPTGITLESIINTTFAKLNRISDRIILTKQERKFLSFKRTTLPAFHVIAKIHKTPLTGRPIIGAVDWVTTRFSMILDILLQKYVHTFPTVLKDSTDLIHRWKHTPFDPTTDWLVSLDVTSLYTNIIVSDAVDLIKTLDVELGLMAEAIMKHNYFEYNNKLYHQKEGIAMGTNCAVALANIYMYLLIDRRLVNLPNISRYGRFIDDICFIYTGNLIDLKEIIQITNTYHRKLSFTSVISKEKLDVLDLTFFPLDNKLEHRTYQKCMNKYLYIPFFSYHPPSCLSGFIKGELLRYTRTNSRYCDELAMRKLFLQRLANRGYSYSYLHSIFHAPTGPNAVRTSIKINPDTEALLILPYMNTPRMKALKTIIRIIDGIPDPTQKITPVWSTTPSLGKMLLKSKLTPEQSNYLQTQGFS